MADLSVLFSEQEVQDAVAALVPRILARLGSQEDVLVVALMNGALWFAADLLRQLPMNYLLETVRVSSYGDGMESGDLHWQGPMPLVQGKSVLLLDDVLDTGKTLLAVSEDLLAAGAVQVLSAVVVDKVPCRAVDYQADFVALRTQDSFLVGYGLDAARRFRNLGYIAEIKG